MLSIVFGAALYPARKPEQPSAIAIARLSAAPQARHLTGSDRADPLPHSRVAQPMSLIQERRAFGVFSITVTGDNYIAGKNN